jgi:hypothetical protein
VNSLGAYGKARGSCQVTESGSDVMTSAPTIAVGQQLHIGTVTVKLAVSLNCGTKFAALLH